MKSFRSGRPVRGCMMSRVRWMVLAAALAAIGAPGCDRLGDMTQSKDAKEAPASVAPPTKPTADQLGAAAGADVKAFYQGEFEGFGAEPDWKLDLLGNWASFTRPGLEEIGGVPTPADVRAGGALVEAGSLSIILKAGACAHPSSPEPLPYVMRVFYDGVTYDGCARRAAAGGAGANPTWAVTLPELIPAIDSCLAQVRGEGKRVTIAYTTEGTQVNVRILDGDGGRYECSITDGAASVDALDDGDVLQGERDPIFTRAPGKPPGASCYKSEDAKGADGAVLGVVSKRIC
jgi:uncharacterized membrane protein